MRDRVRIQFDILHAISTLANRSRVGKIMQKSNTSYAMFQSHVKDMIKKKYVIANKKEKIIIYSITEKGLIRMEKIQNAKEIY